MLGSLQSRFHVDSFLRPLLHLLLQISAASTCLSAASTCNQPEWPDPHSTVCAPAALQDHPILVERTTRLQQPLQYEREFIAETRFTGETPVAEAINWVCCRGLAAWWARQTAKGWKLCTTGAALHLFLTACTSSHIWHLLLAARRPPWLHPLF